MTSRKTVNEPFVDYGDGAEVFVDSLATIEEFGSVTHAVFAVRRRTGADVERRAAVRLIIPTELRMQIGRRLMSGARDVHTSAEAEQLH